MRTRFTGPLEEMADLDREGIPYTVSFTTTEGDVAATIPVLGYGKGWLKVMEPDSEMPAWVNMASITWLNIILEDCA